LASGEDFKINTLLVMSNGERDTLLVNDCASGASEYINNGTGSHDDTCTEIHEENRVHEHATT
jgi:hypothetical protein